MTVQEYERYVVNHAVEELKEDIDVLNGFTSSLLFERAFKYTIYKVPLRLKAEVCEKAMAYFRERWPSKFDEKGELKK